MDFVSSYDSSVKVHFIADLSKWKHYIYKYIRRNTTPARVSRHELKTFHEMIPRWNRDSWEPRSAVGSGEGMLWDEESGSKEEYLRNRDIIVSLIHLRLFVVTSKDLESHSLSSSWTHLLRHYPDKHRLSIFHDTEFCDDLEKCTNFVLKALSNLSVKSESSHSLVHVMLPFMGYYSVLHENVFEGHTTFLETFLSRDGPGKLWSSVLLCLSVKGHASMSVIREYLESESVKTERLSEDAVIFYMAALKSESSHGATWTLSSMDHRLITKISDREEYSSLVWGKISHLIFKIFKDKSEDGIVRHFSDNSSLTEDQKISMKCLFASLPLVVDIN